MVAPRRRLIKAEAAKLLPRPMRDAFDPRPELQKGVTPPGDTGRIVSLVRSATKTLVALDGSQAIGGAGAGARG